MLRLLNAYLYPMDREPIPHGYLDIVDGKIAAIGEMPAPGKADETMDLQGMAAYPGFVDAHSHLGMWEDALGFEGDDGNEDTDPCTPQMRAIDAINPLDRCFSEALEAGVTAVVTGPGSSNPIGGQMCAIKTYGGRIDDMLIKEPVCMKMALGENPKSTFHGKSQSPVTRMATASIIRESLMRAVRYEQDKLQAENDPDLDPPDFDAKCEALLPVIDGKLPVHFHAHRIDDIYTAMRISKEFHLDYIIIHGTQAHISAETMGKEHVRILCGPLLCDRSKPELKDLTPASPAKLYEQGVELCIINDHPVIPQQYLPLCAGLAVREGLPHEEGLKAITINPAKIVGIADRVGSLTVGKDADVVVFDQDPLTVAAKPRLVIAGGKVAVRQ